MPFLQSRPLSSILLDVGASSICIRHVKGLAFGADHIGRIVIAPLVNSLLILVIVIHLRQPSHHLHDITLLSHHLHDITLLLNIWHRHWLN